ncbi:hypothetical protein LSAT2_014022 [Lamellibrachia satsuma]|nr:hypothetical protein LSAT2_014022 [Lamellibrachia satsuma]
MYVKTDRKPRFVRDQGSRTDGGFVSAKKLSACCALKDRFEGGVSNKEEWASGRSEPQGGVSHREEWATGRSEPQGGVGHREEWATGRSGPQGGVSHREE